MQQSKDSWFVLSCPLSFSLDFSLTWLLSTHWGLTQPVTLLLPLYCVVFLFSSKCFISAVHKPELLYLTVQHWLARFSMYKDIGAKSLVMWGDTHTPACPQDARPPATRGNTRCPSAAPYPEAVAAWLSSEGLSCLSSASALQGDGYERSKHPPQCF